MRFAVVLALWAFGAVSAAAAQCGAGEAAHQREGWSFIENNAARTADEYVVANGRPEATPSLARVQINYQFAGDFEGAYLVTLVHTDSRGTVFMMLRPTFDFCSDPVILDDEDGDLFEVVVAKYQGRDF